MKRCGPWLAAVLSISISAGAAIGAERDARSVVQGMMAAVQRADLDAAMAFFADNAVIVNATGRRTEDRKELNWFMKAEIWLRDDFRLDQLRADGNRVTWVEAAVAPFYKSIGAAPVQFAFEATIEGGQILSITAHVPASEITRIREACDAQAVEPRLRGQPCSEFVHLLEAHTRGAAAPTRAAKSREVAPLSGLARRSGHGKEI